MASNVKGQSLLGGRDLSKGPVAGTLLVFVAPILVQNIVSSLNGSINAAWIGRLLGEDALAATTNANLFLYLLNAGAFGFGLATTVLVGQSFGRGDVAGARRVTGTALTLLVGLSVLLAFVGWLFTPALINLLAPPPAIAGLALVYLRILLLSMPPTVCLIVLTMTLRGAGNSTTPLMFMILLVVLDCGLNPVLILGLAHLPRLGIAGSATATVVAAYVTAAAFVAYVYARDLPIRLRGSEKRLLWPMPALVRVILGKGLAIGMQMIIFSFAALVMIGLVDREGVIVTAAYAATAQLWTYVQMPALAMGAAVSAMAAQCIGANRWDRVAEITRAGLVVNLALTGALIGAVALADQSALGLFLGAHSPAIPIGQHIYLLATWGFLLFSVTMTLFGIVRATGAVVGPLLILVVAMLPIRVGAALLLRPVLDIDGLWWSFPIGSGAAMLGAIAYYRYGPWRRARLLPAAAPAAVGAGPTVEPSRALSR